MDANALRNRLAAGLPVEVAGYELHPALVDGAHDVDLAGLPPPACPVVWLETTVATPADLSPAAVKVRSAWEEAGVDADFRVVSGPSFWVSQELADAPALITATTDAFVVSLGLTEPVHPWP